MASSGEIGEPCGVPDAVSVTTPSSNTPTRSHARSSFSIRRSLTRRATWRHEGVVIELPKAVPDVGVKHPLGAPVGLDPDGLKGLVGRALRAETHSLPAGSRPRRSAPRTNFAAAITTRSRTHGIASGRVRPGCPGLGMWTRRSGAGR